MPCITSQTALAERIGACLVIAGAILLAVGLDPTFPAYACLFSGSLTLMLVGLSQQNSAAATMQFTFVVINGIGLLIAIGVGHA